MQSFLPNPLIIRGSCFSMRARRVVPPLPPRCQRLEGTPKGVVFPKFCTQFLRYGILLLRPGRQADAAPLYLDGLVHQRAYGSALLFDLAYLSETQLAGGAHL